MRNIVAGLSGFIIAIFAVFNLNPVSAEASARLQDPETILVAGATGQTGRLLIEQLTSKGYKVRAMTRNVERAQEDFGTSYEWVEGDARDLDALRAIMPGVDRVICSIGASQAMGPNSPEFVDYGGVKNLTDVAKESGVKHFVLISSMGATQPDHFLNKVFGNVLAWKLKGENHLRASGLNYSIIRPGGLQNFPGGVMDIKFMQGDPKTEGLITRADVATVAIEALENPAANKKTFEIINTDSRQSATWTDAFEQLLVDDVLTSAPDAPNEETPADADSEELTTP